MSALKLGQKKLIKSLRTVSTTSKKNISSIAIFIRASMKEVVQQELVVSAGGGKSAVLGVSADSIPSAGSSDELFINKWPGFQIIKISLQFYYTPKNLNKP
jgi:hypothetical protein